MKLLRVLAAMALLAGMVGCTATQQGAVIGTGVGAAAGGIIGHQSGHGLEGAAIGAAAGALTGAVAGHLVDDNKKEKEEAKDHR